MKKLKGTILWILFFFLIILVLICIFLVTYIKKEEKNREKETTIYDYEMMEFDPKQNTTNYMGLVSIPDTMMRDKTFISYENNGNHYLISKFEDNKYECTGTCICNDYLEEEEEKKRRNIMTTNRMIISGLFCLVSAISTQLALDLSQKYFLDKCRLDIFADCEDILVEVGECEEKEKPKIKKGHRPVYWRCLGTCKINGRLKGEEFNKARDFGCTRIKFEDIIMVQCKFYRGIEHFIGYCHRNAQNYFKKMYLTKGCKTASQKDLQIQLKTKLKSKTITMCMGQPSSKVKCVLVSKNINGFDQGWGPGYYYDEEEAQWIDQ